VHVLLGHGATTIGRLPSALSASRSGHVEPVGEVIGGEVGRARCAIVVHGDVTNATGRLERVAREVGCSFIASVEAPVVRPLTGGWGRASRLRAAEKRNYMSPTIGLLRQTPGFVASETRFASTSLRPRAMKSVVAQDFLKCGVCG
jgi:hypothetical protein